jgi:hypothetical protein
VIVFHTALSAETVVDARERLADIVELTSPDGRMRPLGEMGKTMRLKGNAGDPGLVCCILSDTVVPDAFMQKMFRRSD